MSKKKKTKVPTIHTPLILNTGVYSLMPSVQKRSLIHTQLQKTTYTHALIRTSVYAQAPASA